MRIVVALDKRSAVTETCMYRRLQRLTRARTQKILPTGYVYPTKAL
jgi:hypothetical protein